MLRLLEKVILEARLLISFELFQDVVRWLATNDGLMNELNTYKDNKADWSRRKSQKLCCKVEIATGKFLETKEIFKKNHRKIRAISSAVSLVAYDYIHSDSAITDKVNLTRGWKHLKFSLRRL